MERCIAVYSARVFQTSMQSVYVYRRCSPLRAWTFFENLSARLSDLFSTFGDTPWAEPVHRKARTFFTRKYFPAWSRDQTRIPVLERPLYMPFTARPWWPAWMCNLAAKRSVPNAFVINCNLRSVAVFCPRSDDVFKSFCFVLHHINYDCRPSVTRS